MPGMIRLTPAEHNLLLRVVACLARPRLLPEIYPHLRPALQQTRLQGPLPCLRALAPVEPVMRQHLIDLEIPPAEVFRSDLPGLPALADLRQLTLNSFARTQQLRRLILHLNAQDPPTPTGIAPMRLMLIKGAALARRYPSPALRVMSDLDLVVASQHAHLIHRAMNACGWHLHASTWHHPAGHRIDVHYATTPAARDILEASNPLPMPWPEPHPHVETTEPDDADHLVYLAAHAVRHAGSRLWLDFCDLHLLLEPPQPGPDLLQRATQRAHSWGKAPQLAMLLRLYQRFALPHPSLTSAIEAASSTPPTTDLRGVEDAMAAVMLDPISGTHLAAIASLLPSRAWITAPFYALHDRLHRHDAQQTNSAHPTPAPTTPPAAQPTQPLTHPTNTPASTTPKRLDLDQPPPRFIQRQLWKLHLAARLLTSGRLLHYIRLAMRFRPARSVDTLFNSDSPTPPPSTPPGSRTR